MARTRSSAYGNALGQIPNWVFGGEFGDISNLLNNREQEYETTRREATLNDIRDIALEQQQRQQQIDEEMRNSDIFADGRQPTLGEMYDAKRKIAMQYGGIDDVLSIEKELAQIKAAQEKEARDRIMEQRQDEEWAWRKERRGSPDPDKPEKTVSMFNLQEGILEDVPASTVVQKQKLGTHIRLNDPRTRDLIESMPNPFQPKPTPPPASEPGFFQSVWDGFVSGTPTPTPAPTPVVTARGDTARQGPAPGDQVKKITRNTARAVKGQ